MQIVVFEDELVPRLYPMTVGRPAYAITCGSYRLIDWLTQLSAESGVALRGVVRPHLTAIQQLDFPTISPSLPTIETPALLVNARLVPSVTAAKNLQPLLNGLQTAAVYENGSLASATKSSEGSDALWLIILSHTIGSALSTAARVVVPRRADQFP